MDPKDSRSEQGRTVEIFPPIEVQVILQPSPLTPTRHQVLVSIGNPLHPDQPPTPEHEAIGRRLLEVLRDSKLAALSLEELFAGLNLLSRATADFVLPRVVLRRAVLVMDVVGTDE